MLQPPDTAEPTQPPLDPTDRHHGRAGRGWLAHFRDGADLKSGLVSAAIGYLGMELANLTIGPLPPAVMGFGALGIALVALFGVVPVLRRGRWQR